MRATKLPSPLTRPQYDASLFCPQWVLIMHATSAVGGILVHCNWHLSADEVGYVLENVRRLAPAHPHTRRHPCVSQR